MSKKFITLSVCIFATTQMVFGQQKDSLIKEANPQNTLEQVVVTANKMEQKQNSTGKIVSIINAAQLEANAGRTVSQILNEQAGLYLPGSMSNLGTVPTIYMRGASSGRTLILIDGVPVGDPSMISNEFDLNLVPLDQIERIEILKGAQSTLYGSDAIGGVINIITKSKLSKSWTGSFASGSYGTQKISLQHAHQFHNLSLTMGYESQKATGYSAAMDTSGTKQFDRDGYQNKSWFIHANYHVNQYWDVKLYTQQTAYKADIDYAAFKDDKDDQFHNATNMSGITLKYKKEQTNFQLQYQYNTQDRLYKNDSIDKRYIIFEDNHYWGKSHFADVFFTTPIHKNIRWIIGSDFRYGSYHQTYTSISTYGPYNDQFKDTFQFQNALYTSVIISDNAQKWLLETGARYNHHSRYGSNSTFTLSPSYKLNSSTRIIASISSGYKVPSLYELSYNDKIQPEKSINAELGFAYTTNQLFARVVLYNRNIKNGIDYNYVDYNFFNFIQQKVKGIELESNWHPNAHNQFNLRYTYLDGQETNQNRVTTVDTITYPYLLKRPAHTAGIQWQHQINTKLSWSISANYTSKRYDVGGYATKDVTLSDYTLVHFHAQYLARKHWTLFADGQNITNTSFQEIYGYNTMGSNWIFGIRLH
jgi:vitamin B12 transporter